MKVKIEYTVDIDQKLMKMFMEEFGEEGESIKEFLTTYLACHTQVLDENIYNALGEYHRTDIVSWDLGKRSSNAYQNLTNALQGA